MIFIVCIICTLIQCAIHLNRCIIASRSRQTVRFYYVPPVKTVSAQI
nr:MAG TPA: hypothetical protein [Caudoviricetes sp.]